MTSDPLISNATDFHLPLGGDVGGHRIAGDNTEANVTTPKKNRNP